VPHGVKMNYDGKPVDLTVVQEEAWVRSRFSFVCVYVLGSGDDDNHAIEAIGMI
jgi:hypothetical protein